MNKFKALHAFQQTIKPNDLAMIGDICKLLAGTPREHLETEIRRILDIFDLFQKHTTTDFFDDVRTAQRFAFMELICELVGAELITERMN